jgi:hypothetical protein
MSLSALFCAEYFCKTSIQLAQSEGTDVWGGGKDDDEVV